MRDSSSDLVDGFRPIHEVWGSQHAHKHAHICKLRLDRVRAKGSPVLLRLPTSSQLDSFPTLGRLATVRRPGRERVQEKPYDVVLSRTEDVAVATLGSEGRLSLTPFSLAYGFKVRLEPKADRSRIIVFLDSIFEPQLKGKSEELGFEEEELVRNIASQALGELIDESGAPEFTPSGKPAVLVPADAVAQSYFDRSHPAPPSDEEVLSFIARKAYWAWRHGMVDVPFTYSDARRLGVSLDEMVRIALAGDGVYWRRVDQYSTSLVPTSRLLADVPAGAFPGLERPLLPRVVDWLRAPRYEAARTQFARALEFFDQETPDLANGLKEAVASVESLALTVIGREKGTLGDCIKDLKANSRLKPQLGKALESLWGFASEEHGVRHGKAERTTITRSEAVFMLTVAGAAIRLLLDLDT